MIIAHRGESFIAPENTLAAINLAWEHGADAIEIDVHLTYDNEIVVIHDKRTGRTGNINYSVKKSPLAKLKEVDVGVKKGDEFIGEKIPTLQEVIQTVPPKGKLIIEIKCGTEILAPLSIVLEHSKLMNHQIELICFDLKVISDAKKFLPQFKALWLLNLDYYLPHWMLRTNVVKVVERVNEYGLDGINGWAGNMLNRKFVRAFKKEGLWVYTWTINDVQTAEKLIDYGVDAITTDRPAWLTHQLAIQTK